MAETNGCTNKHWGVVAIMTTILIAVVGLTAGVLGSSIASVRASTDSLDTRVRATEQISAGRTEALKAMQASLERIEAALNAHRAETREKDKLSYQGKP
jgi:3-hydroxyacyl-CoA dehydrogenase